MTSNSWSGGSRKVTYKVRVNYVTSKLSTVPIGKCVGFLKDAMCGTEPSPREGKLCEIVVTSLEIVCNLC